MDSEATKRALRLFGEFVVIVVGVLTALGVDQLAESRAERVMERELLESLIEDLRLDSADFASLPRIASRRAWGAEILLREFAPDSPRSIRVEGRLEELGTYPEEVTDRLLVGALAAIGAPSDLDVASGAYGEFSGAGGQRLVRNQVLRRAIHEYYASVQSNVKFDPRVNQGMRELSGRLIDLGLDHGDDRGALIRERLRSADPAFFASLRMVQVDAIVQGDIADVLLGQARSLIEAILEEVDGTAP